MFFVHHCQLYELLRKSTEFLKTVIIDKFKIKMSILTLLECRKPLYCDVASITDVQNFQIQPRLALKAYVTFWLRCCQFYELFAQKFMITVKKETFQRRCQFTNLSVKLPKLSKKHH